MSQAWTAEDMPDQTGRTALVTGATGGVGFFVARGLARKGATVVMAVRAERRGAAAAEVIRAAAPGARLEVALLDLSSLASVRAFAGRYLAAHEAPDLIIACAGIMAVAPGRSSDGFDLQLAVNFLGHFALTGLLIEGMLDRPRARVVAVSSVNHRLGKVDLDDLQLDRGYRPWKAYNQSKLANLLWAFELDRRLRVARAKTSSVAAHPGYSATRLQHGIAPPLSRALFTTTNRFIAQSPNMGALPLLYAATAPGVPGGAYIGPDGRGELRGHPGVARTKAAARDPDLAARLWRRSEDLTGVTYPAVLEAAAPAAG